MSRRQDPVLRFMRYVEPDTNGGCWLWSGAMLTNAGYGNFPIAGKATAASRAAWRLFRGEIPARLFVLHRCDVRLCCNPAHLFLGTHADNMADMVAKGRSGGSRGASHPRAKLSDDLVRQIRTGIAGGVTQRELAARIGVHEATIQAVHERRTWKHVPDHFDRAEDREAVKSPSRRAA